LLDRIHFAVEPERDVHNISPFGFFDPKTLTVYEEIDLSAHPRTEKKPTEGHGVGIFGPPALQRTHRSPRPKR
jgi:hypothetical protein